MQVVLAGAWNAFLHVLVHVVSLHVHTNLGALSNARWDVIVTSTRYELLALLDHARASLCSNAPACSPKLRRLILWIVTAGTGNLKLGILGLELGAHTETRILFLVREREVVATRADTSEVTILPLFLD